MLLYMHFGKAHTHSSSKRGVEDKLSQRSSHSHAVFRGQINRIGWSSDLSCIHADTRDRYHWRHITHTKADACTEPGVQDD
jgi:hypothetical protein